MFRLSAAPRRWIRVTAPVFAPEATVNLLFLMRKVEMARELALEENPKVSMAVVVEIPDPLSEVGVAFVVLTAASTVTPEELRRECRARLANYKAPKQIVILDEVPRLELGKVDRNGLRALARERFAPEDP
jgi:acyl-CoA synthetase (AMP-forming)/AMP-acid ligase II